MSAANCLLVLDYNTISLDHSSDWMSDCVDAAEDLLTLMEPQHLSNICWSLAKMDYHPGGMIVTRICMGPDGLSFTPRQMIPVSSSMCVCVCHNG